MVASVLTQQKSQVQSAKVGSDINGLAVRAFNPLVTAEILFPRKRFC